MRRTSLVIFFFLLSLLLLLRPARAADECNVDDFLKVLEDVTKKVVLPPTTTAKPTTTTATTTTATTATTTTTTTAATTTAATTTTATTTTTTAASTAAQMTKTSERANPLAGCLTVTSKESGEFVSVEVNCTNYNCINFAATLPTWYESLEKNCGEDQKKKLGATDAADVIKGIKDLVKLCGQCQVNLARLSTLKTDLEESGCKASCSEPCLQQWNPFLELRNDTSVACTTNIPETLSNFAMYGETVVLMCNPVCNSTTADSNSVTSWFQQWQTEVANSCISPDASEVDLIFDNYGLDGQCAETCKSSIKGILDAYGKIPSVCQKGLVQVHFHDLEKSISATCDNWFPELTTTQVFFGVTMAIVGIGMIYCVCGSCYRRFRLKKKGWEIIPPFRICQKKSTQRPRRKRNLSDDEEVILFDAEEIDDDHL